MTMDTVSSPLDVLAIALFEAYSRNAGNPPQTHHNPAAAHQWMAQALDEVGVADMLYELELMCNQVEASIVCEGLLQRLECRLSFARNAIAYASGDKP